MHYKYMYQTTDDYGLDISTIISHLAKLAEFIVPFGICTYYLNIISRSHGQLKPLEPILYLVSVHILRI